MVRASRKKQTLIVSEDCQGQPKHVLEFHYQDASEFHPSWNPPMDIYETETDLVILLEAAGLDENSLQLHAVDNRLVLNGERKFKQDHEIIRYHQLEIQFMPFQKTIVIPGRIDEKKVRAEYHNGMLTIRVSKRFIKR